MSEGEMMEVFASAAARGNPWLRRLVRNKLGEWAAREGLEPAPPVIHTERVFLGETKAPPVYRRKR